MRRTSLLRKTAYFNIMERSIIFYTFCVNIFFIYFFVLLGGWMLKFGEIVEQYRGTEVGLPAVGSKVTKNLDDKIAHFV